MKTLEALQKYLTETELKPTSILQFTYTFKKLASMYPEMPDSHNQIMQYLQQLKTDGLGDVTRRNHLRCIRVVCKHMYRMYDVPNPCDKIPYAYVKIAKKEPRFFTAEECMRILQAARTPFERILIMLLIETGARISELHPLMLSDLEDNAILTSFRGKTGAHRYQCSSRLISIIRNTYTNQQLPILQGMSPKGHQHLNALKWTVRHIIAKAGITGTKVGPHTFRHSVGQLIADKTDSIMAVQTALQHADMKTSALYIASSRNRKNSGLSPLQIIGEQLTHNANAPLEQMSMPETKDIAIIDKTGKEIVMSTNNLLFQIPPGFETIRPRLTRAELETIATAFTHLTEAIRFGKIASDCKTLWDRMLRKQG